MIVKIVAQRHTCLALNEQVSIDKVIANDLGEQHPKRTFAGAGHANQDDVLVLGKYHGQLAQAW